MKLCRWSTSYVKLDVYSTVLQRHGCILRTGTVQNKVDKMLKIWCHCVVFPSADAGGPEQAHWWSDGADQTPAGEAWQAECAHQDAAKSGEKALQLRTQLCSANQLFSYFLLFLMSYIICNLITESYIFQVQQSRQRSASPRSSNTNGSVQGGVVEQRDSPVGK